MIWLTIVMISALAMLPLIISTYRTTHARGRREAALALHLAQLAELDRDLNGGQIGAAEHSSAMLEVQRRLLAVHSAREDLPNSAAKTPLLTALIVVPLLALALYLTDGSPSTPSIRDGAIVAQPKVGAGRDDELIAELRARLSTIDQKSDTARAGYILLGNAEATRGNMSAAARAWGAALAAHFDPALAVETAEALTEAAGHVTDKAAALFRRALAEGLPDAPWRSMAKKRLGDDSVERQDRSESAATGN